MQKEKYGFVYIWFDRKHRRYYIGSHWGNENDSYICSSTWMRNAYRRRPKDFKRRIISRHTNKEEMYQKEYEWLCLIKECELGKRYYNFIIQKYNLTGEHKLSEHTRQKMSVKKKGTIPWNKGKEIKVTHSDMFKNKPKISEETREKMRQAKLGRKLTDEHKKKIGESSKGRPMPNHVKEMLINMKLGKPRSKETINKIKITKAAKKYCQERNYEFALLTEDDIFD